MFTVQTLDNLVKELEAAQAEQKAAVLKKHEEELEAETVKAQEQTTKVVHGFLF